jgi:glycogen(starch) synthase
MRLLLWSYSFWPNIGGVEVLGAHFVTAMRGRGHELLVMSGRETEDVAHRGEVGGVPVLRIDARSAIERNDVRALAAARAEVTRERNAFAPDVDHIFYAGPELMFSASARAQRPTPVVFSLHLKPDAPLLAPDSFYGRELRSADRVTACSEATLAAVEAQTGKLERARVILNALPPMKGIEPAPLPEEPVLLFIGRVTPQKGFDFGLEALAALRETRPGLRAIVAGDGPDLESVVAFAAELGVADAVEFTGWVDPADVPALMARATVVVMPSRFEPFGLVALEAAQNSRPLVGFDIDGLGEAVAPGAGVLVPPEDVPALTEALAAVVDHPARAREMGEAGHRHAVDDGPWQRHLDAYEALYAELATAR